MWRPLLAEARKTSSNGCRLNPRKFISSKVLTHCEEKVNNRQRKLVGVRPGKDHASNPYPGLFSDALKFEQWDVRGLNWFALLYTRFDFVVIHWPDRLITPSSYKEQFSGAFKLVVMLWARFFFGTRYIWVAHNAKPHGKSLNQKALGNLFFGFLDGVIFLSMASRMAVLDVLPILAGLPWVVVPHGHYRSVQIRTPTLPPGIERSPCLTYFGQIRTYKGIDTLMRLVAAPALAHISLIVAGQYSDPVLQKELEDLARATTNIRLKTSTEVLPQEELEAVIDRCHGVVLPYRDVLNSGAALLALSRNRPVLVPNIGSMPELQGQVGSRWVHLYDGELTNRVLLKFSDAAMNLGDAGDADLTHHDWNNIGEKLRQFLSSLN